MLLLLLCLNGAVALQAQPGNALIALSQEPMAKTANSSPNDGWYLKKSSDGDYLLNSSNKDYLLSMQPSCMGAGTAPSYLIEYSDAYRDGTYGGVDFASSEDDQFDQIVFSIDGEDYGNPFAAAAPISFKDFIALLSRGNKLVISFYQSELNPETGEEEQKINRSIDFRLKNGDLLQTYFDCR